MSNGVALNNEEITLALNLLTKKNNQLQEKFSEIIEIQKKQHDSLDKQNVLIEQLSNGSLNKNSDSSGNSNIIDQETLILKIREILLEDEELMELFTKVVENISTFNHNKDKVDTYINNEKKSKKSKKPIFVIIIAIVSFIFLISYFMFSNNKTIIIPSGVGFYEMNKKDELALPENLTIEILDEDELRYYFKIKNKKYYINKTSIK